MAKNPNNKIKKIIKITILKPNDKEKGTLTSCLRLNTGMLKRHSCNAPNWQPQLHINLEPMIEKKVNNIKLTTTILGDPFILLNNLNNLTEDSIGFGFAPKIRPNTKTVNTIIHTLIFFICLRLKINSNINDRYKVQEIYFAISFEG